MLLIKLANPVILAELHFACGHTQANRDKGLAHSNLRELKMAKIAEGFIISAYSKELKLYFACECLDDKCVERVGINFSKNNSIYAEGNQIVIFPMFRTQRSEGISADVMNYDVANNLWKFAN